MSDPRRRTRIALLIPTLDRAGAEKQLALIASSLDRRRFEPYVLCLRRTGPYEKMLREAGVPIAVLGQASKLSPPLYFRLRAILREIRPQILHTWLFTSHFYGRTAALAERVPILIASERCVDLWKTPLHWMIDRRLARRTNAFVANAGATLAFLRKRKVVAPEMISIPNALGEEPPAYAPDRPPPDRDFLAAGRLHEQKDYPTLFAAFAELLRERPSLRLDIAGDGPDRDRLVARCARLGLGQAATFLGHRADIHDLMRRSRCFVLSSHYEGSPNSLLEAMAAGTPVVTTDAGGSAEAVPPGCGQVVPVRDPKALAAAMRRVLDHPEEARRQADEAARIVRERHALPAVVAQYEALYERLLKQKGLIH